MALTQNKVFHKVFIVFMSFMVLLGSFVSPKEKASANPIAAAPLIAGGAAAYSSVGMYVLGALLVSAGAGALGVSHADEIKTHATNVWNGLNDTTKTAFNATVEASLQAGNSTISLSEEILADIKLNTGIISDFALSMVQADEVFHEKGTIPFTTYNATDGHVQYRFNVGNTMNGIIFSYGAFSDYQATFYLFDTETAYSRWTIQNEIVWGVNNDTIDQNKLRSELSAALSYFEWNGIAAKWGIPLPNMKLVDSATPSADVIADQVAKNIDALGGVNEVNIPLDNFLAKDKATGQPLDYDATTGTLVNQDGTTHTGDTTWDFPIPGINTGVTAPTVASPAIPITGVGVNDVPVVGTPTGTTPPSGGGTGETPWLPIALMMGLFDLLRAILMYLARMFTFIMTIPLIPAEPIQNEAFNWFRSAEIIGVQIYNVVSSLASIGLAFIVYRSVRRLLP